LYDHLVGADYLGTTRYEPKASPDDDFAVLVDRGGNRFCVLD
jgi:hypothetical protein